MRGSVRIYKKYEDLILSKWHSMDYNLFYSIEEKICTYVDQPRWQCTEVRINNSFNKHRPWKYIGTNIHV